MGSSYRSENSRFRAAIKILQTRDTFDISTRNLLLYFRYVCFVDKIVSLNFEHLGLGNNRQFRYHRFQVILSDTVLQLMNGTRGRFMHSFPPSIWSISFSSFEPVVVMRQSRVVANRAVDSVAHSLFGETTKDRRDVRYARRAPERKTRK